MRGVRSMRYGREVAVGLGALGGSGLAVLAVTGISSAVPSQGWGPATWPGTLAVAMCAMALVLLARAVLGRQAVDQPEQPVAQGGTVRLLASLGLFVAYGIAWQWLDFRFCTVLLISGLCAIGGGRGVRALVLFPVGLTALLWLLFGVVLEVPL